MQKPVAKPVGESRFFMDVTLDLLDRLGLRDKYNQMLNAYYTIEDEALKIKPGEKLTWSQIGERVLRWVYGEDAEKIRERRYATWHKPIEDVYWRWHYDSRVPLYMKFLLEAGQGGLWAQGRPIARGKGSNFCKLLPTYLRHYDPVTGNIETSVALKVYRNVAQKTGRKI